MVNITKKTLASGAVVCLALSAGLATTANAAVNRLSGADRFQTGDQIVKAGWSNGSDNAILASGLDANRVDALTVAPLAKKLDAPVVLVNPTDSKDAIVAKFTALKAKTVYIANGTGVISADVEAALKAQGITVERLGGLNRYQTALNIAKQVGASDSIVIANGEDSHLVDSLSIASIAAAKGMPIFLTTGDSLDSSVKAYIDGLGAKNSYVLGGSSLVSDALASSLPSAQRLSGANRYATNVAVINAFKNDSSIKFDNIYVASGEDANLIDALGGAALAGKNAAPIVLAHDGISSDANDLLSGVITDTTNIAVLGGSGAVTESVKTALSTIQDSKTAKDLKVESVTALDSTHIAVKYNQNVETLSAEDYTNNYTINPVNANDQVLSFTKAELQDDKRTVKLTVDKALDTTGVDYTIDAKDVRNVAGDKMGEYKAIVTLKDDVAPTVTSIDRQDNDTMKINFSEAVQINAGNATNFINILDENSSEIDYSGLTFTVNDDNNAVTISGLSSLDKDKNYTVVVKAATKDLSSNAMGAQDYTKTFTVAEDNTKPSVVSITPINLKAFNVTFSEPLKFNDDWSDADKLAKSFNVAIEDVNGITTYGKASVDDVAGTSNKTFTVELDGAVPAGMTKVTIQANAAGVTDKGFVDPSGNQGDAYATYVKFVDSQPTLKSTTGTISTYGGEKYVVYTFNQDLKSTPDTALPNIKLTRTDSDGIATESNLVILGNFFTSKSAAGTVADSLDDNQLAIKVASLDKGTYTLTLPEGVVNAYGSNSKKTDVSFALTTGSADVNLVTNASVLTDDSNKPLNSSSTNYTDADGNVYTNDTNKVIVAFDGEVGASALNANNYKLDGINVFSSATYYHDKKHVKLTIADNAITVSGEKTFSTRGIVDTNGNSIDDKSVKVYANENQAPYVAKAELTALDTVVLTFNEGDLKAGAKNVSDDFKVYVNGNEVDLASAMDNVPTFDTSATGKSTLTLTLKDKLTSTDAQIKVVSTSDNDIQDKVGNGETTGQEKNAVWNIK